MPDVWTYRVSGGERWDALLEVLSADEKARLAKFRFERNRREFLCAHALVRLALSQYADVSPGAWAFATGTWGKPYVPGDGDLRFNLSHTEGLVACAVARGREVGVDVEKMDRTVEAAEIAKRFFAAPEARYVEALEGQRQREAFFRIWTLKEAYVKACGRGFNLPLKEFGFELRHDGVSVWPAGDWAFWEFEPEEGYRMAVAAMGANESGAVLRDGGVLLHG